MPKGLPEACFWKGPESCLSANVLGVILCYCVVRWYWVKGTQGLCVYYFLHVNLQLAPNTTLFKFFFLKRGQSWASLPGMGRCGM